MSGGEGFRDCEFSVILFLPLKGLEYIILATSPFSS